MMGSGLFILKVFATKLHLYLGLPIFATKLRYNLTGNHLGHCIKMRLYQREQKSEHE